LNEENVAYAIRRVDRNFWRGYIFCDADGAASVSILAVSDAWCCILEEKLS